MSLLGIDVGTSGCKSVLFSEDGTIIGSAYAEYDIKRPRPDAMELDPHEVWQAVQGTVAQAVDSARSDPCRALSVTSMGEAFVPVSRTREILGPSILLSDPRGTEYIETLRSDLTDEECYRISGNPVGSHYGLPKLMWVRDHEPELYRRAYKFLNWSGFVAFMLGAEPTVDFTLANRDLLFDIRREEWSPRLLSAAGIDETKLPTCVRAGTPLGKIEPRIAEELGLPPACLIVSGPHDQCANALGCGAISPGDAMYGLGTFPTIVPIFDGIPDGQAMIAFGLNTEHHAIAARYVSFLYHMGGAAIKWYRDTFAAAEVAAAIREGGDVYPALFSELPPEPGPLLVLPHLYPLGPPDFLSDSAGVILGLRGDTRRGAVLKAILEANAFALKVSVENLRSVGIGLGSFKAVGGGSRSDAAVQVCTDIFNRPFERPTVTEAGALGAAILAGVASEVYPSAEAAVGQTVRVERRFDPNERTAARYEELYAEYLDFARLVTPFARRWMKQRGERLDRD